MQRWVRQHERLYLALFLPLIVLVTAGVSIDAWLNADRTTRLTIALAWIVPVVGLGAYQVLLWWRGRLVITDPDERELARERNARNGKRWLWPAVGIGLGLNAAGGHVMTIISGLVGGAVLAMAPGLLYTAFVLRPDEHVGEHLDAGPFNRSSAD
jgi:hypothetical protein